MGACVADHRIDAPTELAEGDEIRLGPVRLRFESVADKQSTRTQRRRHLAHVSMRMPRSKQMRFDRTGDLLNRVAQFPRNPLKNREANHRN